jgi:hypothetical protein
VFCAAASATVAEALGVPVSAAAADAPMVAVVHVADGGAAAANVAGQAGQRAKAADRTVESTGPAQPHFLLVRPLSRQPPRKSRPSARAKWEGGAH